MFTKQDEKFAETAADPVRRVAAITDLTSRRTILFAAVLLKFPPKESQLFSLTPHADLI